MKPEKMLEDLLEQGESIKNELLDLEQKFNLKKEQFLKIQGAIEALNMISESDQE